jgi:hypothetical protein
VAAHRSCALNLELYAADPGPQTVAIGGPGEQRTITRRDHLLDLYSRMLLLKLDGDPDRLSAVAAEAERRRDEKSARNSESDDLEVEADTLEFADTAMRIIHDAGADVDQQNRKRLLTAMNYQTSATSSGPFSETQASPDGPTK